MPSSDTPPVLTSDIESAEARQAATDSQSASSIDSAISRSTARTQSNATQAGSAFVSSARGAAGSLVVTFSDIEAMASAITANTAHTEQILAQVAPISTRPDLVESVILSPVTGAEAEVSVVAAAGRLGLHIAMSEALGIVSITIVSTYQLVDTALSASAASLRFVGSALTTGAEDAADVGGAILKSAGNEIVTSVEGGVQVIGGVVETSAAEAGALATAILVAGFALNSVAEGFLAEGFTAWFKSFGPTFNQFAKDPWLLLAAPISIPTLMAENTVQEYSVKDAWNYTIDDFQGYLGALGPGYDVLVHGLVAELGVFGWKDGGKLVAQLTASEKADEAEARAQYAQQADLAGLPAGDLDAQGNIIPNDLKTLLLGMGQTGALGGTDEAVIRVVTSGNPPTFTLIIPPTEQWPPWGSTEPNDLLGNLNIMTGNSQLEQQSEQALLQAMNAYNAQNPTHQISISTAPVMVAGFSQGGITAGAFAQDFSSKFHIEQVVTIGAPIGKFDIPPHVHVLAYEANEDIVPRLDGTNNPTSPNWETITGDDGGGFPGSHNPVDYANMAANGQQPQSPNDLSEFFGAGNKTVTDYYATK